jgi:hypothetical protein
VQRSATEAEQFLPHCGGEDWVLIAHDQRSNDVEVDNLHKEDRGDGRGGVKVVEKDEVRILGEAIDNHQDHWVPACLQESLNEVHGYVLPYRNRDVERLEKAY